MASLRILLVDDSPEFLTVAMRILSATLQLEVVGVAHSGCDAIEQVARLQPDLVLMDVSMPSMDGLQATARIKALGDAPYIVMVTLYDCDEYRAASAALGADGFIAKADFATALPPLIHTLFAADARHGERRDRTAPPRERPPRANRA